MKKLGLTIASICLIACPLLAQVNGKLFPTISGETMNDKVVKIPEDIKGKYSIIGLAYSRGAEDDLKTWLNPAYNTFINPNRAFSYDINMYFVPIFTGTTQSLTSAAKKKVNAETDKEMQPHILFSEEKIRTLKKELAIEDKDIPYFFVLDKEGKIIHSTSGRFSAKKMEEIEDKLE